MLLTDFLRIITSSVTTKHITGAIKNFLEKNETIKVVCLIVIHLELFTQVSSLTHCDYSTLTV